MKLEPKKSPRVIRQDRLPLLYGEILAFGNFFDLMLGGRQIHFMRIIRGVGEALNPDALGEISYRMLAALATQ